MNDVIFLLGASKCGTTSLHKWLSGSDRICGARPKECRYFSEFYYRNLDWYYDTYFDHRGNTNQYCLDSSIHNMYLPYVRERINETFGNNVKFIMLIRNPAERFISDVHHFQRMRPGREPLSVSECFSENLKDYDVYKFTYEGDFIQTLDGGGGTYRRCYLEKGTYIHYIKEYDEIFLNNVLIIDMSDLNENKTKEIICDYLEIPLITHSMPTVNVSPLNENEPNIELALKLFYSSSIAELCIYCGIDYANKWRM